jgi:hypothetical protein
VPDSSPNVLRTYIDPTQAPLAKLAPDAIGGAVNPYLGFLTGWLMIAAYVIATVSGVEVLGPTVLAVFGASAASISANLVIATAVGVIMLVIAIVGIRITARTQVGMAVIEYALLLGFGDDAGRAARPAARVLLAAEGKRREQALTVHARR